MTTTSSEFRDREFAPSAANAATRAAEVRVDEALEAIAEEIVVVTPVAGDEHGAMPELARRVLRTERADPAVVGARRRRMWRAVGVSLSAHAVLAVAAATIVINQAEPVDNRDRVLSIELSAVLRPEGDQRLAELPATGEREDGTQDAAEEPSAGQERPREERLTEAGMEPAEPEAGRAVESVVTQVPPERWDEPTDRAAATAQPSLAGWLSGGHEGARAWTSFDAGTTAENSDGTAASGTAAGGTEVGDGSAHAPVRFAGASASGEARSVVYVVDASGPMVTSMSMVLEELVRSVWGLDEGQSFSVVLFREGRAGGEDRSEHFADELVPATLANKRALARWLSASRPEGRSNPLTGLEQGLTFGADVVFLLSRSVERSAGGVWGEGLSATMDRLEGLNPPLKDGGRPVQIQSIAFLEDDPTGLLQAIAESHGPRDGSGYRVVRAAEDLREQPAR